MSVVVPLLDPIRRGNSAIRKIELRNPGRATLQSMAATRREDGWREPMVIRFASHLSAYVETTLSLLSDRDLRAVHAALNRLFQDGRRRLNARTAPADEAREQRGAGHG